MSTPAADAAKIAAADLKSAWSQAPNNVAAALASAQQLDGLALVYTDAEAIATLKNAAANLRTYAAQPSDDATLQAMQILFTRLEARGDSSDATKPAQLNADQANVVGSAEAAYAQDVKQQEAAAQAAEWREKLLGWVTDNPVSQWINSQARTIKIVVIGGVVIAVVLGGVVVWKTFKPAAAAK